MGDYISEIRKKVGHDRILVPGTSCVIVDDGRVLMLCRSDTGLWCVPGGVMDCGETVIESLRREVREESGLEIGGARLLGIYSGSEFDNELPNGDRISSVTHAFLVEEFSGELTPSDESPELEFFPLDALPGGLEYTSRRIIEDYLAFREGRLGIPAVG